MAQHGFELVAERDIAELKTNARLFSHVKTHAQLLSLENDDENKSFGITFRTPPPDGTGVAHILEHSVLTGSQKYPVKEPFTQMVKGSLRTFLNAMTFADKTAYPVASQNLQDFYNLVDVYLDAVFHPLLTRETFEQEGWHIELDDVAAPLAYKGVVFNEMKGAYSSPDAAMYHHTLQSLFPDNHYRFDSGGEPAHIPELTYEQFVAFYRTYYHPSNALIVFCGDDDPTERLRRTDAVLANFEAQPVDGLVALQPRIPAPRRQMFPYDAGQDGTNNNKAMVSVNWMLDEYADPSRLMELEVLSHLLMGTPAAALRKALLDSGLGEEYSGGVRTGLRQMTFSAGLKGVKLNDGDRVEPLILGTLERLAAEGLDRDLVEAALNTFEFRLRENNTGSFPRGLSMMFRTLSGWQYGHDPIEQLAFEAPLRSLKQSAAAGGQVFQDLIRAQLLQNSHRVTVTLEPDPALRIREEAAEKEKLGQIRAAMSEAELREVAEHTRALKRLQGTPDAPEALATLPMLKLTDLDRRSKPLPIELAAPCGSTLLYHDIFTNGIVYLDVVFDLRSLPPALLGYVPLFGRTMLEMGTQAEDYAKLVTHIGRKTGGISPASLTTLRQDDGTLVSRLMLRGKATMAQAPDLLEILSEILLDLKLDNRERFRQIVLQEKAREEAAIVPSGSAYASNRMRSYLNAADWAREQMGGVSYLFFLRSLLNAVEDDWPSVVSTLDRIHKAVLNRRMMAWNVTLDQSNWQRLQPQLSGLIATIPAAPIVYRTLPELPPPAHEGLVVASKVNFVVKGDNLYRYGYLPRGSTLVATRLLSVGYLHDKLRVQGGAYGGGCSFDRNTGVFAYSSYRDPNLLGTVDVFDRAAEFLRHGEITVDELHKNIIGLSGQLEPYQLPDAKGYSSMARYLSGVSDDSRQQTRDEVLATTVADVRALADVLEHVTQNGTVVVVGSADAVGRANAEHGQWLKVTPVM